MQPLAQELTQPHAPQLTASLWFEYARLLGTPTVLGIAAATLLHGCYCELSSQAVHWGIAVLIVAISLTMSVAFWYPPRAVAWVSAGSILVVALSINSRSAEACEVHQGFLAALTGMCAGTVMAIVASRSNAGVVRMSTQDGTPSAGEAVSETQDTAAIQADALESPPASIEGEKPTAVKKSAWGKWLAAGLLLFAFLVYMIVVPVITMLWEMWVPQPAMRLQSMAMSSDEQFRLHAVSGIIMAMFLAMGASVGSFLNVVIFRLPRGRALLWPPSACAACGNRIIGRDNIPILAWLNLSGRCRHCAVGISARYPIVEAIIAGVFVLFFYRELLSGGENLPVRTSNLYKGIVWILFYTKWDLLTIYFFHMFVLSCLFGWGMINLDRFRVPKRALLIGLLGVVASVAVLPHLNPLLAGGEFAGNRLVAVANSLVGVGIGGLLGLVLDRLFKQDSVQAPPAFDQPTSSVSLSASLSLPSVAVEELEVQSRSSCEAENSSSEQAPPASPDLARQSSDHQSSDLQSGDLYGSRASIPSTATDAAAALALLGAAFGYQAAVCVGLVTIAISSSLLILKLTGLRWHGLRSIQALPITLVLFGVAVVYLMFWKSIHLTLPQMDLLWLANSEAPPYGIYSVRDLN